MRRVSTQRSPPSSVTLQVSQQINVCSVSHLRPRWSADVLVPTRGRTRHLHRGVGESGIGSGYKVHEVWHFQDKTNRLFRGYIDMFLKKKQEASGWPGWCQTDEDKERYLQEYKNKEGIDLDRDVIQYNAGARTVWKQVLNNLWAKMGHRLTVRKPKSRVGPQRVLRRNDKCRGRSDERKHHHR